MNRGDRREPIFQSDEDRLLFLKTLAQACEKTDWQIHAWCFMSNHFHLVVETPRANLVEGMQWLLGVYTNRFNHRHKEFGHLFSGRYKALHVDGGGTGYLKAVCDYVHLNPVRAHLIGPEQPLESYRWSSYQVYLSEPGGRPAWLRVDRLFGEWGIPFDSPAGRKEFALRIEARRKAETLEDYDPKDWCSGSEDFRNELLAQVSVMAKCRHAGPEINEAGLAKAERIAREELERLNWSATDLKGRCKSDPQKVRIAVRLRGETTMTLAWIADRLCMGAPTHLASLLQRHRNNQANSEETLF
jgi:REP element-mobilizing transposase RayT